MAEEIGVAGALARIGLNVEDVMHLAEQRALRAVMVESGRVAEMQAAHAHGSQRPQGFSLSAAEKERQMFYMTIYVDAIALGWRAKELSSE